MRTPTHSVFCPRFRVFAAIFVCTVFWAACAELSWALEQLPHKNTDQRRIVWRVSSPHFDRLEATYSNEISSEIRDDRLTLDDALRLLSDEGSFVYAHVLLTSMTRGNESISAICPTSTGWVAEYNGLQLNLAHRKSDGSCEVDIPGMESQHRLIQSMWDKLAIDDVHAFASHGSIKQAWRANKHRGIGRSVTLQGRSREGLERLTNQDLAWNIAGFNVQHSFKSESESVLKKNSRPSLEVLVDLLNQQDSFAIAHLVLCREFEMENVGQRSNPDGYDAFHNGLLVQIRRQSGPTQANQIFTASYPDAEEQRRYLQRAWIRYLTLQPD